ncbi:MAG: M23 family metallopeptidase [Rikenellaceae bacterium]|nr:M23 family metallopeptidase [Rikenellaceae bacterium]
MARKRYKFNPETLKYEAIVLPFRIRFYRFLRSVLIAFMIATVINTIFSYFFYTPKMYRISRDRDNLLLKYQLLNDKISASNEILTTIMNRDKYVYRTLFAIDTMTIDGIYSHYPESKYRHFENDRFAPLIKQTWLRLDQFTKLVYAESVSLDQLMPMANDKSKMAESVPAIWPLDRSLIRNLGFFGRRRNPVTGRTGAMHEGMDFSGAIGTSIYATGNGVVVGIERKTTGYGRQILIDHGYGYRTRYAHLSKIDVVPGQIVKRGEKIGEMGNTGKSTGPHLHYEVIYRGTPVDPISYFSPEMSREDFVRIIENAQDIIYEAD